jgi:hypothetical protein
LNPQFLSCPLCQLKCSGFWTSLCITEFVTLVWIVGWSCGYYFEKLLYYFQLHHEVVVCC